MKKGSAGFQIVPFVKHFCTLVFIIALAALAYSVARSGFGYMYDADEVARMHEAYLLVTGQLPYRDYFTIYSPIFPMLMMPLLYLKGFTFQAIDAARLVMTVLFFVRIGILAYVVRLLFGIRAAYIFAALYLLDPFSVFSAMQVRADNLMLTVLAAGLVFLARSLVKNVPWLAFAAGFCIVLSMCIMVKSFPTALAVSGIYIFYAYKVKNFRIMKAFAVGGATMLGIYIVPFVLNGTFTEMFRQSILAPGKFMGTPDYPTPLGFFYGSGNWFLYGEGGKPLTWVYAWVLPVLGFAGAYHGLINFSGDRGKEKDGAQYLILSLVISLAAQWGLLFTLHTVFIQYYIPVMWLFAFFGAYSIDRFITASGSYAWGKEMATLVFLIVFLLLVRTSYNANIFRSKQGSGSYIRFMQKVWSYVPGDAKVFPMVLFRPPAYPLAEGYFAGVHSGLLDRYEPVEKYLERDRTPFVLASDYTIGYLKPPTQVYIREKYSKVESGFDLMVRKDY